VYQSRDPSAYLFISVEFKRDWRLLVPNAKPFLCAAFLCQNVLQEKDGSLSAIRIMDRATIHLPSEGLPEGMKPAMDIKGLIAFKSGDATGDFNLTILVRRPNGTVDGPVVTYPFKLQGGDHGQNIILQIGLGVDEEGLYWFDVRLNDETVTEIPLNVEISKQPQLQT
jgi:hypothetical protein